MTPADMPRLAEAADRLQLLHEETAKPPWRAKPWGRVDDACNGYVADAVSERETNLIVALRGMVPGLLTFMARVSDPAYCASTHDYELATAIADALLLPKDVAA